MNFMSTRSLKPTEILAACVAYHIWGSMKNIAKVVQETKREENKQDRQEGWRRRKSNHLKLPQFCTSNSSPPCTLSGNCSFLQLYIVQAG